MPSVFLFSGHSSSLDLHGDHLRPCSPHHPHWTHSSSSLLTGRYCSFMMVTSTIDYDEDDDDEVDHDYKWWQEKVEVEGGGDWWWCRWWLVMMMLMRRSRRTKRQICSQSCVWGCGVGGGNLETTLEWTRLPLTFNYFPNKKQQPAGEGKQQESSLYQPEKP